MSDGGAPGGPCARSPGFCSRRLTPDGRVDVEVPAASFRGAGVQLFLGLAGAEAPEASQPRTRAGVGSAPAAADLARSGSAFRGRPGGHAAARPDLGASWRVRARGPGAPALAPGEWVRGRRGGRQRGRCGAGLSERGRGARGLESGRAGHSESGSAGAGARGEERFGAGARTRARAEACPCARVCPCTLACVRPCVLACPCLCASVHLPAGFCVHAREYLVCALRGG